MEEHLARCQQDGRVHLDYIVRTTPSSMHSFYELAPLLDDGGPFVLTTVDTVFRESDFKSYVAAMLQCVAEGEADGLMGVTDFMDDEQPLYVKIDVHQRIVALQDADSHPHYVSGGIYGLTPRSLVTLRACIERGEHRMRNFQRALLDDGLRLKAWPFGKVLDVDHATYIAKAEAFLND